MVDSFKCFSLIWLQPRLVAGVVRNILIVVYYIYYKRYYYHQGKAKEGNKVERVAPGENQGLEVLVDRRSDRQTMISKTFQ